MKRINKISVIIPCYNEEKTIMEVVRSVEKELINLKKSFEIIVVDDSSTDNSLIELKVLEENKKIILLEHQKNLGKGAALKTGIKKVTGDIVIIQDADLEYNPKDFANLLLPFEEADADIVYRSRFLGGKYVRVHFFWHYLANKILTSLCNIATNLNLSDMETGYKVFKASKVLDLNLRENSFGIEPEITIKLAKKNCKFFEVPISYNGRTYQQGKKFN